MDWNVYRPSGNCQKIVNIKGTSVTDYPVRPPTTGATNTANPSRLSPSKVALPGDLKIHMDDYRVYQDLNAPMRERDRIRNAGLVCRDGCVEKELEFTSITDIASQRPRHFALIARL